MAVTCGHSSGTDPEEALKHWDRAATGGEDQDNRQVSREGGAGRHDEERKRGTWMTNFEDMYLQSRQSWVFFVEPMRPTSGEERPHWVKPIAPRPQSVSSLHYHEVWFCTRARAGVLVGTLIGLPHHHLLNVGHFPARIFNVVCVRQDVPESAVFTNLHNCVAYRQSVDCVQDDFSGFNEVHMFCFV